MAGVTAGDHQSAEGATGADATSVQRALNGFARDAIGPVSGAVTLLYLVFAAAHQVTLPQPLANHMSALAGATALVFLAVHAWSRWGAIPSRLAHPLGAALVLVALANITYPALQRGDAFLTTDYMLVVLAAGLLFLSRRWHAAVVATTVALWAAFAAYSTGGDLTGEWTHYGFAMLSAVVISGIVHAARLRTFTKLEAHRQAEAARKDRLRESIRETTMSEDRYRRLAEAAFEAVLIHHQGETVDANHAVSGLFGYPHADAQRMGVLDLVAPVSRDAVSAHLTAATGRPITVVARRCNGDIFPVEVRARPLRGHGDGVLAVSFRAMAPDRVVPPAIAEAEEAAAKRAAEAAANIAPDEEGDAEDAAAKPAEPLWVRFLVREMKAYAARGGGGRA